MSYLASPERDSPGATGHFLSTNTPSRSVTAALLWLGAVYWLSSHPEMWGRHYSYYHHQLCAA